MEAAVAGQQDTVCAGPAESIGLSARIVITDGSSTQIGDYPDVAFNPAAEIEAVKQQPQCAVKGALRRLHKIKRHKANNQGRASARKRKGCLSTKKYYAIVMTSRTSPGSQQITLHTGRKVVAAWRARACSFLIRLASHSSTACRYCLNKCCEQKVHLYLVRPIPRGCSESASQLDMACPNLNVTRRGRDIGGTWEL